MESHKNQCSVQFFLFNICLVVEVGSIEKNFLYADDTQLYLLMEPDQTDQLLKLQADLRNQKVRMTKMSYS